MSDLDDAIADSNSACLEVMGLPITYQPLIGDAIETYCWLAKPTVPQGAAPAYFGEIEVDPSIVTNPRMGDTVVWADGGIYVVKAVINPPRGLCNLTLHRRVQARAHGGAL